jgi:hypothetical protein
MGMMKKKWLKCCSCGDAICCPNRDCPDVVDGSNFLPTSLTVEFTASFPFPGVVTPPTGHSFTAPPPSACWDFSFEVFLIECRGVSGSITYTGTGENTCTWCSNTYTNRVSVVLTCGQGGGGDSGWILTIESSSPPGSCELPPDVYRTNFSQSSCTPILLTGDMNECFTCDFFVCQIGGIVIAPGVIVPVIATHPPFCLSVRVYE